MPGHRKTLNPRQAAFAQNIVLGNGEGMSYTDAALKAGYKPSPHLRITAAQTAQHPLVKAEINALRSQARATLQMTAEQWGIELLKQYEACDNEGDRANALAALDKWAKRLNLYEQHESSSRATEVLSALAGIGARMIASRQGDKAPVTVEARISGLLHNTEERAPAPSRTRVLTVGESDNEAGGTPSGLADTTDKDRDSPQL